MTLGELIDAVRADSDDRQKAVGTTGDAGLLSKTRDIVRWLNEAQAEAAVRARLIYDDTQTIDLTAGTSSYPFTGLFEITRATVYRKLTEAGPDPLTQPATYQRRGDTLYPTDQDTLDRQSPFWRDDTWQGCTYVQEDTRIYLPGVLKRDYLLRLEGYRLPVDMVEGSDVPEIAPIHHKELVHWALHRAYSKPDADIFNPGKAATAEVEFERYFGFKPTVSQGQRNQANRPHRVRSYW